MSKTLKIIALILLGFVLIVVGAYLWFDKNQGKIAGKIIKDKFMASPLSKVYNMDFSKLDLKALSGKIVLYDFILTPDSLFFKSDDTLRLKHTLVLEARIPYLLLSGFDAIEFFMHKNLTISAIEINNPQIRLIDHLSDKEKEIHRKQYTAIKDTTKKKGIKLQTVKLDYFGLKGGNAEYYKMTTGKSIFTADSLEIHLADVTVDLEDAAGTIVQRSFSRSEFGVGRVKFLDEKGFYDFSLEGLALDLADNSLKIDGLKLIPKHSKAQFGKKYKRQTDRFDVSVGSIDIEGIDLESLITKGSVIISSINIDSLNLGIYRDKNVPFDFTRYPKFPWQSLATVKNYLEIKTIEITNSFILYEELAPDRSDAGKVPLKDVHITLGNISNDSAFIARNGPMTCRLDAKVFNKGDLILVLDIPEDLTSSNFGFSGKIGMIDMREFNTMTELNAMVQIEKGYLDSLIFVADANDDYATGELTMVYDSLKINLLKKDGSDKEDHDYGFISWMANKVLRSSNPKAKRTAEKPSVAPIFVERDKNKSIFNYIVKAFISGIKGSLVPGVGPSLKKYQKKQIKETKKEERQQKREERKKKK